MNKSEVTQLVADAFQSSDLAKLWWGLELPGLGKARPNDVWENDPEKIVEYVKGYKFDPEA